MKKSDIIRKSGIDRTYCYQIFNGTKVPSRDKIISLSIAASLTLQETQRALEVAKEATLYSRNRRDAIFIYAINHGLNTYDTEELLCYFDKKKVTIHGAKQAYEPILPVVNNPMNSNLF